MRTSSSRRSSQPPTLQTCDSAVSSLSSFPKPSTRFNSSPTTRNPTTDPSDNFHTRALTHYTRAQAIAPAWDLQLKLAPRSPKVPRQIYRRRSTTPIPHTLSPPVSPAQLQNHPPCPQASCQQARTKTPSSATMPGSGHRKSSRKSGDARPRQAVRKTERVSLRCYSKTKVSSIPIFPIPRTLAPGRIDLAYGWYYGSRSGHTTTHDTTLWILRPAMTRVTRQGVRG